MNTRKKKNYGGGIFTLCKGKNCARVNNTFSYKNPIKDIAKRLEKISNNNDKTLQTTEECITGLEKFIGRAKVHKDNLEKNISNAKDKNSETNNKNSMSTVKKKYLQLKIKDLTARLELVGLQIDITHRVAKALKKNSNAGNIPSILKEIDKVNELTRLQKEKNDKIIKNLNTMILNLN